MKKILLLLLCAFICTTAHGKGASDNEAELLIPTLTKLHLEDPLLNPTESSYSLEAVTVAGVNTVTKYLKNPDGTVEEKHYQMNFKDFGDGDDSAPNAYYYKWEDTIEGKKLVAAMGESDADIKVYLSDIAAARVTTNLGGADIDDNFAGLDGVTQGGAIYNSTSTIGNITGDFIGNYASSGSYVYGGAIYNANSTIGNITGDFIANCISSSNRQAYGGAIYNYHSTIGNITGDFIGNYVSGVNYAHGGAIHNNSTSTIGNITGDFIGNYASSGSDAQGGAIYNVDSTIGNITGDFIGNYASGIHVHGGAIYNVDSNVTIDNITGDFIANYISSTGQAFGGAIYNVRSTISDITGDFIANYTSSANNAAQGGAIYNVGSNTTIGNITGDFIGNHASSSFDAQGGAIYNAGYATIGNIAGDFIDNYASGYYIAEGGAIYNDGGTITITDGSFLNNYAKAGTTEAKGGAIYATSGGSVNLIAKNENIVFSGNYTNNNGTITSNAVHMSGDSDAAYAPVLNLNASAEKSIIFNDAITSESDNNVININKEGTIAADKNPPLNAPTDGIIYLNADMSGFGSAGTNDEVNFYNGTLKLGQDFDYFGVPVNVISGGNQLLDISANNKLDSVLMNKFILNNDLNVLMDVDLVGRTSDTFEGTAQGTGDIKIAGYNFLSHTAEGTRTDLSIADADARGRISLAESGKTAYSPIYRYDVSYNNANGVLTFRNGNPGGDFNPAIMATSVATQAGAYATQLNTFRESFNHMDRFMNMERNTRFALKNQNRTALSESGANTPFSLYTSKDSGSLWYSPNVSIERVNLKGAGGTSIDNITYGSYFGGDFEIKELKNGWSVVNSLYGGYTGAHQSYEDNGVYQNGATLGATSTFYKNDIFAGVTASAGYMNNRASTMYGNDNFNTVNSGIALKAGRNFEYKKLIAQPSMMLGHVFVKTFDYTTSSGVNIRSNPLHAIVLQPGIKLIGNFESGWQPYIAASAVWNIMGQSKVRADNVYLPELSVKPYAQYGVGVQKVWDDRFSCFLQTMARSGGRKGVDFSAGLNISIGKDSKKKDNL